MKNTGISFYDMEITKENSEKLYNILTQMHEKTYKVAKPIFEFQEKLNRSFKPIIEFQEKLNRSFKPVIEFQEKLYKDFEALLLKQGQNEKNPRQSIFKKQILSVFNLKLKLSEAEELKILSKMQDFESGKISISAYQMRIIKEIKNKSDISNKELAKRLGYTEKSVERFLDNLRGVFAISEIKCIKSRQYVLKNVIKELRL